MQVCWLFEKLNNQSQLYNTDKSEDRQIWRVLLTDMYKQAEIDR